MNEKGLHVCVFGASNSSIAESYTREAYLLGKYIAEHGWTVVNGAGQGGIMRACTDGAMDHGGSAVGVIPLFMVDRNWHYRRMSEIIVTSDMHVRKQYMHDMSGALVVMPGGVGTLDELMESLTWRQLSLDCSPVIILNVDGFYDSLLSLLDEYTRNGVMRPCADDAPLWYVCGTASEAVNLIESLTE